MHQIIVKNSIKEHRARLNLTQKELAERINISRVTMCKIEKESNPCLITAYKIASSLGRNILDIFYFENY